MTQNVSPRQRLRTPAGVATVTAALFLIGLATRLFTPLPDAVGSGFGAGAVVVGTAAYVRVRKEQQDQQ